MRGEVSGEDYSLIEMCIRDRHYNNAFHFQVVRLCSNRLIESIYTGIMDLIGEQIFQTDGVGFYEKMCIRDRFTTADSSTETASMRESVHMAAKFTVWRSI